MCLNSVLTYYTIYSKFPSQILKQRPLYFRLQLGAHFWTHQQWSVVGEVR